jgi:hypothetical protein
LQCDFLVLYPINPATLAKYRTVQFLGGVALLWTEVLQSKSWQPASFLSDQQTLQQEAADVVG